MTIRILAVAVATLAIAAPATTAAPRDVLYVGNNWDGTADVVDPFSFQKLARMNIVPDKAERMAEIEADPARLGFRVPSGEIAMWSARLPRRARARRSCACVRAAPAIARATCVTAPPAGRLAP